MTPVPTPTFTADQVSEMVKQQVAAAMKSQSEKMPAATSSFFSSYAPWLAVYGVVGCAAAQFYRSRKPAEGQSRLQCAAKDFPEVVSLGLGVGTAAVLSWPIISLIAPSLDGSWLKAGSQLIASPSWQGMAAKMATAAVSGFIGFSAWRAAAKSLQGVSKTERANQELGNLRDSLMSFISDFERTRIGQQSVTEKEAKKNQKLQQIRTKQLNNTPLSLYDRFVLAFHAFDNTLKERENEINSLKTANSAHRPQSHKQPGLTHHAPADPALTDVEIEDDAETPMSGTQINEFIQKVKRMSKPQATAALKNLERNPIHYAQVAARYKAENPNPNP